MKIAILNRRVYSFQYCIVAMDISRGFNELGTQTFSWLCPGILLRFSGLVAQTLEVADRNRDIMLAHLKTFDNISDNYIDVLPRINHGCFVIPIAWVRGWGRVMLSQSHVMFNVCPTRVM